MRRKEVKLQLDKAYEIINTLRPGKGSALGKAVTYALNQKDKPYVINRKNSLFSDTEKGADASAAVMSIIETFKVKYSNIQ